MFRDVKRPLEETVTLLRSQTIDQWKQIYKKSSLLKLPTKFIFLLRGSKHSMQILD